MKFKVGDIIANYKGAKRQFKIISIGTKSKYDGVEKYDVEVVISSYRYERIGTIYVNQTLEHAVVINRLPSGHRLTKIFK